MIFNILDNTTELYMTKYIIGEILGSGGATLYKNLSDQTVSSTHDVGWLLKELVYYSRISLFFCVDILLNSFFCTKSPTNYLR